MRPCADHPRSRGVYLRGGFVDHGDSGSSPLARGLRGEAVKIRGGCRIIPARAGFTDPHGLRVGGAGDHPRSRGVYSRPCGTRRPARGSSPLARGLRQCGGRGHPLRGIIPARAGFTAPLDHGLRRTKDHPRSRGVYSAPHAYEWARPGSSPLARGLRPVSLDYLVRVGIIPARAGFTRVCRGR